MHLFRRSQVLPGEEFAALRSRLHGRLHLPFEAGWDAARTAWQLAVDQRPVAVVEAADVVDVSLTVREARRLGLAVAPQSTGHGAGTIDASGAVLVRTRGFDAVAVDPGPAVARVGSGATAGALAEAAQRHGLAAVLGMAPSVGVVGMTLGGGLGWFARSHGLAANSVTAIEGINATGAVVRADASHHPDLFWAARGGVAPIIVTALEVSLHRIGDPFLRRGRGRPPDIPARGRGSPGAASSPEPGDGHHPPDGSGRSGTASRRPSRSFPGDRILRAAQGDQPGGP